MLGISMPFPVCLFIDAPPILVAWLGIVPPVLALVTAVIYIKWCVCVCVVLCAYYCTCRCALNHKHLFASSPPSPPNSKSFFSLFFPSLLPSAGRVKVLSARSTGLHGFQVICLFVYKYILDTGFALVSCRPVKEKWVSHHCIE